MKKNSFLLIGLIFLSIIGFLAFRYVSPFGKVVTYIFTSKLPGTEDAVNFPSGDNSLKIPSQIIRTSQTRLSVKLSSREIDTISTKLRFKNSAKEIVLGLRGSESDSFNYYPLYNSLFEDLNWDKLQEKNITLWQRNKKYSTLTDFVGALDPNRKIATYYFDTDKLLSLQSSNTTDNNTTITTMLRGNHTFFVKVAKSPLTLKVSKQDFNGYDGGDKLRITVSKNNQTFTEQTIEDDGDASSSHTSRSPQETTLTLYDINPGIYQVALVSESTGGDVFTTKLEINQPKVVFKNYIFDVGPAPTNIWTNAPTLGLTTWHKEGLQTVVLDYTHELKISELNKKYTFDLAKLSPKKVSTPLYQLDIPQNDLIIEGQGYFAFNENSYFDPEFIHANPLNTQNTLNAIDYILTSYQKIKHDGDWLEATLTIDPKNIKISGDKLYLSLEMPNLAKYGGQEEIETFEVSINYKGVLQPSSTSTPTPTTTSTTSPTPTSVSNKSVTIKILNAGATSGTAGKLSKLLLDAGYTNTETGNSTQKLINCLLSYPDKYQSEIDAISKIINSLCKTTSRESNNSDSFITLSVGSLTP